MSVSDSKSHREAFPNSITTADRQDSVMVERSPGMPEVSGSISGRVKQKTLKMDGLLLCLALSTPGVSDQLAGSESG